ncbi:MAG: gluconokinase [Spirochaetales bacterium]|nr:gluconokinase [Spirochaetales bacterium]
MIIIVMGVSGCGKSTVAEALAQRTGGEYLDADSYHPAANVAKMSAGIPLTDEDRAGWLQTLAQLLKERAEHGRTVFMACSALKEAYRRVLRVDPQVRFVYLKGDYAQIAARLQQRSGHFMKETLLRSQFASLEEPRDAVTISIEGDRESIVAQALAGLGL